MEKTDSIIHTLFHPKSVAVIGASSNPAKGGYRILKTLTRNNYKGKIYPVNPKGGEVLGLKIYKTLDQIEDENGIDVAIIFIPNRFIPDTLERCIEMGVKAAIIEAAGFEEVGSQGLNLRDKIKEITGNFSKIRVVGPNCTGLTSIIEDSVPQKPGSGFFSSFIVHDTYRKGNIAIISQSGMLNGGYFTYISTANPTLGFKYIASIGNMMDLNESDFLQYFLIDDEVKIIAIYLEMFKRPRKFIGLCKKAKKMGKKVYLLKGGQTRVGQKATLSHTGALASNINLGAAVIKQAHVQQANSFEELILFAKTAQMLTESGVDFPKSNNIAFVTVTGGAGSVSTDLAVKNGLNLPQLSDETYNRLLELYPPWMPPNRFSLADLWPAIEGSPLGHDKIHELAIDAILSDPKIDGLLMSVFYSKTFPFDIEILYRARDKFKKPVFAWAFGVNESIEMVRNKLNLNKIPNFSNLEMMMRTYRAML